MASVHQGSCSPLSSLSSRARIKEVLGNTVPYFEGDLPENTLRLLGVRSDVTVADLLDLLREHSGGTKPNPGLIERVYSQLDVSTRNAPQDIRTRFSNAALIFAKGSSGEGRWYKSGDCVWEDASAVLGDDFAYLSAQYPKLQDFFVGKLKVKQRADTECFAQRWLKLQEQPITDLQQRDILVKRLYREVRPVTQKPETERPPWWRDFASKVKVYTQSDVFELPPKIVLPDDGELRDIFRGNGVEFAWRLEGARSMIGRHFTRNLGCHCCRSQLQSSLKKMCSLRFLTTDDLSQRLLSR